MRTIVRDLDGTLLTRGGHGYADATAPPAGSLDFLRGRGLARDWSPPTPIAPGVGGGWRGHHGGWSGARTAPSPMTVSRVPTEPPWASGLGEVGYVPPATASPRYDTIAWEGEVVLASRSIDVAAGESAVDLGVNMQNAWWVGATNRYPGGLVLYVDADQALNLYSVDGGTVLWTSAGSSTDPNWCTVSASLLTRAAIATNAASDRIVIVWVASDRAVVAVQSADGDLTVSPFSAPVAVSTSGEVGCQQVSALLTADDTVYVVYAGTSAALSPPDRAFVAYSADGGATWSGPQPVDDPADPASVSSFPTVAVSGDEDENGDGPVLLFAWRDDSPDPTRPSRTLESVYYRSVTEADFLTALAAPRFTWANPVGVIGQGTKDDNYRDPCAWCTAAGRFWVSGSGQPTPIKSTAVGLVADSFGPAHGGSWATNYLDVENPYSQNYVNGVVEPSNRWAFAAWEYGEGRANLTRSLYGALLDLEDPRATWAPVGQVSTEVFGVESIRTHTGWVTPDRRLLVFYIWESADGAEAELRLRHGSVVETLP